ncbi:MAG: molybdopterin adenylyltransferase [Thermodesulfobacteriota bacterium]
MITVGILTMSDKGSRGEREDISGQEIRRLVNEIDGDVKAYDVIPDERTVIEQKLKEYVDDKGLDLVLTTGGTGVSPRDVTPEATMAVIEKDLPGMAEAMRAESLKKTPNAVISRAVAGIRKRSIIINLPGSPKAVRENLGVLLRAIPHAVKKLKGDPEDCGKP